MKALLTSVLLAGSAVAQSNRDVQFQSVDFELGTIEVHNFGPIDIDLTGWRFCSHDQVDTFEYSFPAALNGVTLEAGSSIFVHMFNDAPFGDPDRFNQTSLGNFASTGTNFDPNTLSIQFFFPAASGFINFNNGALVSDIIQWSVPGTSIGNADVRTQDAVDEGLWVAEQAFIPTTPSSVRIELTDFGNGLLHGPDNYTVFEPGTPSVETVRLGVPPNPDALRPGLTSGPVIGATWDPFVDHSSFFPGALVDLLAISGTSVNIPSTFGTLLIDPSSPILLPAVFAGAPLLLDIPVNPALVGVDLFTQAFSTDGFSATATNALDITIGS